MGSNTELANSILDKLKENNGSMETLEIARSLGKRSRKDVNPTLYRMQRNGLILKVSTSPPKWGLKHEVTVGPLHGATADGGSMQEAEEMAEESLPDDVRSGIPEDGASGGIPEDGASGGMPDDGGSGGMPDDGGSGGMVLQQETKDMEAEAMEDDSGGNMEAANHSNPAEAHRSYPPPLTDYNGALQVPVVDPMPSPTNNSSSSDDSETAEQPVAFAKLPPTPHELQQNFTKPFTPNGMDHRLLIALSEKVESIHSNDLAKQLGYRTKKEINPTLFSMQKKGLVRKVCESPPMWVITPYGQQIVEADVKQSIERMQNANGRSAEMAAAPQPGTVPQVVTYGNHMEQLQAAPGQVLHHVPQSPQSIIAGNGERQFVATNGINMQGAINAGIPADHAMLMHQSADMETKVMCALSNQQTQGTVEIVHNVGLNRGKAKDVNPSLYGLAKRGYITKVTDSPPTWRINDKGLEFISKRNNQNLNGAAQPAEINQVPMVTGSPVPIAQLPPNLPSHPGMVPPDPRTLIQGWDNRPGATLPPNIPTQVTPIRATTMPYITNSFPNPALAANSTPVAMPPPQPQSSQNAPVTSLSQSINNEMFAAINKNPVSALTEYAQARHLPVSIDLLQQSGPPHNPRSAALFILLFIMIKTTKFLE